MLIRQLRPSPRSGAAAVEFAIVMNFVMIPLMIGVWEMGRVVYCQQVVANSAREGARMASQGMTINTANSPTQIVSAVDDSRSQTANVRAAVYQYLVAQGLTNLQWGDVNVGFSFLDPAPSAAPFYPGYPAAQVDPWQGVKGQRFKVTVEVTYAPCRWTNFWPNPDKLYFEVQWRSMADDPFTVNINMPNW